MKTLKMKTLKSFFLTSAVLTAGIAVAEDITIPAPGGVGDVAALVTALNNISSYETIYLSAGTYDLSETSMSGDSHLRVTAGGHRLVGLGATPAATILQGGGADDRSRRVLELAGNSSISNLTVAGGYSAKSDFNCAGVKGGEAYDCLIRDNHADQGSGGGAYELAKLVGCTLENNSAGRGGACFECVELMGCTFRENVSTTQGWAENSGGCLYTTGSATIDGCTFTNNTAAFASCLQIKSGAGTSILVTNCTFVGNHSEYDGTIFRRAGYGYTGTLKIVDCDFIDNDASNKDSKGGALHIGDVDNSLVKHCTFAGNTCAGPGGAACGGSYEDCLFTNNVATGESGAIHGLVRAERCRFYGNSSVNRRAGAVNGENAEIVGCTFQSNSCALGGGAAYLKGGCVRDSVFIGNEAKTTTYAQGHGGAIDMTGNGVVSNCTFVGNLAKLYGGAICDGDTTTIIACKFRQNKMTDGSGGKGGGAVFLTKGTVRDSFFADNEAQGWYHGGDICNSVTTFFPVASNCTFSGSSRCGSGHGDSVRGIDLIGCTFVNVTNNNYTAISDCNLYNCFLTNNVATKSNYFDFSLDAMRSTTLSVGCVYANNTLGTACLTTTKTLVNCTFADNARTNATADGIVNANCKLVNCLFVDNSRKTDFADMDGTGFVATNCSFSALGKSLDKVPGAVNCRMLPRTKVRFEEGSYRLAPTSRAKNWAYSDAEIVSVLGATDLYGQPRYRGAGLDVGAAESPRDNGLMLLVR